MSTLDKLEDILFYGETYNSEGNNNWEEVKGLLDEIRRQSNELTIETHGKVVKISWNNLSGTIEKNDPKIRAKVKNFIEKYLKL